jgi:hypothetical protein
MHSGLTKILFYRINGLYVFMFASGIGFYIIQLIGLPEGQPFSFSA